jgi:hypothetical protein
MAFVELQPAGEVQVAPSGLRPLDRLLPRGGVPRGSLIDWLCDDDVSGGATLACAVGALLAAQGGTMIVVDRSGRFYPPAIMPWVSAAGSGGARGRLVVARPARDDDDAWAIDQALRCAGVAVVVAWPKRIHPTAMRRWQVAARSSQAVGLIVRPGRARREPSWAMHRIAVAPLPGGSIGVRRLRLSLVDGPWSAVNGSGGHDPAAERAIDLELDLTTGREAVGAGRSWPAVPQPSFSERGAACRAS